MRFDTIKAGDEIYTKDGTMLRAIEVSTGVSSFEEYEYNEDTNRYDRMIDTFRLLTKSDIENIMHDYDGNNHRVTLTLGTILV